MREKTALVNFIVQSLGSEDSVTSPTFSIINEYLTENGVVFHMDMYRLKNTEEAIEIGFDEYISSGNLCLIEWPDIIRPLVNRPYIDLNITVNPDQSRNIEISLIS